MRVFGIAVAFILAACAGKAKQEPLDKKTYDDHPMVTDETPRPLDEAECGRMYDHLADLGLSTTPEAERAKVREDFEASRKPVVDECVTGQVVSREQFDCFMAAATWDAVKACAPAVVDGAEVERVE